MLLNGKETVNDLDFFFMAQALQLAEKGLYTTTPNPCVGCVIVKNNQVIAYGWHQLAGQAHAEVDALQKCVLEQTQGSTAYVTLEPCCHYGRTSPCTDQLIKAGIHRVVVAMEDPNPRVSGQGLMKLRQAGIAVCCGVLEHSAKKLNLGFIKRMTQGIPRVTVKMASSLDGCTAMDNGDSKWITGAAARQMVQKIRARSCGILTGSNTILMDDARLTVRYAELINQSWCTEAIKRLNRQPLRIILDSKLQISTQAKVFNESGSSCVITRVGMDDKKVKDLNAIGAQVYNWPHEKEAVDLNFRWLLELIGSKGCNELLVESGSILAGQLLQLKLVDELIVFMAPKLMGSLTKPLFSLPFNTFNQSIELKITDVVSVGQDLCIKSQPIY